MRYQSQDLQTLERDILKFEVQTCSLLTTVDEIRKLIKIPLEERTPEQANRITTLWRFIDDCNSYFPYFLGEDWYGLYQTLGEDFRE